MSERREKQVNQELKPGAEVEAVGVQNIECGLVGEGEVRGGRRHERGSSPCPPSALLPPEVCAFLQV